MFTTGIPVEAGMDLHRSREALIAMIDHLEVVRGLTRPAAYALCSACVDLRISEVVDVPYPLVSACSRSTSSTRAASRARSRPETGGKGLANTTRIVRLP